MHIYTYVYTCIDIHVTYLALATCIVLHLYFSTKSNLLQGSISNLTQESVPSRSSSTIDNSTSGATTPASLAASPILPQEPEMVTPSRPVSAPTTKKRKVHPSPDQSQQSQLEELIKVQLKDLSHYQAKLGDDDDCDRFGEEVASEVRKVADPYRQALCMREIREVLFKYRFGHVPHQPQQQLSSGAPAVTQGRANDTDTDIPWYDVRNTLPPSDF